MSSDPDFDDLLDALRRVADDCDEPPDPRAIDRRTDFWPADYVAVFGSWSNALALIGVDPSARRFEISDTDLLTELRRLGDEVDRRPTYRDLLMRAKYDRKTYQRRFGSWREALRAAGYDRTDGRADEERLLAELRRVADELGREPTYEEMDEQGGFPGVTYLLTFDSFRVALDAVTDPSESV